MGFSATEGNKPPTGTTRISTPALVVGAGPGYGTIPYGQGTPAATGNPSSSRSAYEIAGRSIVTVAREADDGPLGTQVWEDAASARRGGARDPATSREGVATPEGPTVTTATRTVNALGEVGGIIGAEGQGNAHDGQGSGNAPADLQEALTGMGG